MQTLSHPQWTLKFPPNWELEQGDDYILLFDPQGSGELILSTSSQEDILTPEDLLDIAAEDIESGAEPDDVKVGDFVGIQFDYETEGEYWSEWYLLSAHTMLFVTYNCPLEDEGKETPVVDIILNTLRAREFDQQPAE